MPGFMAVVSGRLQMLGDATLAGAGKAPRDGIEQLALIFLERNRVMAATFEHCLDKRPIAMQRIASNDTAFERQHAQNFQRSFGLIAAGRFARRQGHPGFGREDIDHVQRRAAFAALVSASQRLAIDGNDAGELDPMGLGEGCRELPKGFVEGFRSSARSTRLNVSWLGMPCSSGRNCRSSPSFERANSAMSVAPFAPHSVAASAMTVTSSKS